MVPISLICGILNVDINLALYGLETTRTFSIIGIIVVLLFALKGMVSFGLWTEKDWAVRLAIIDASVGIGACAIIMIVMPFMPGNHGFSLNLRLELIALIPYLLKMKKIKTEWESMAQV